MALQLQAAWRSPADAPRPSLIDPPHPAVHTTAYLWCMSTVVLLKDSTHERTACGVLHLGAASKTMEEAVICERRKVDARWQYCSSLKRFRAAKPNPWQASLETPTLKQEELAQFRSSPHLDDLDHYSSKLHTNDLS